VLIATWSFEDGLASGRYSVLSSLVNTLAPVAVLRGRCAFMLCKPRCDFNGNPMKLREELEDEISFWQDMIERQPGETPREVIERMEQARMLAERKLAGIIRKPRSSD
jgi:hypothetical protein